MQFKQLGFSFAPRLLISFLVISFSGCAHHVSSEEAHARTPEALLNYACRPGTTVQSVQGNTMMKVNSKDGSGQFPASVKAQAPDQLRMEATNLIGATQAVITVQGRDYQVQVPTSSGLQKREQGRDSWGGIPLRWAAALFLGRIPCAEAGSPSDILPNGDLRVQVVGDSFKDPETFTYHFRDWDGHPWPESLHWERKGTLATQVDFKFDHPDGKTGSPLKWEAKSQQGEVKVIWKDRSVH
jgi:hypothetical protein